MRLLSKNLTRTALGTLAGVALVVSYAANAAACESDEECGAGYICETYEYAGGCSIPIPDCAPEDETCWERLDENLVECDPETYTDSYCQRAPCEADADCGTEMVCLEYESGWCTGSAVAECSPDGTCDPPETTEECGTEVTHECGYAYEGECETATDCGAGFDCVPQEDCYCTGGTVPSAGGAPSTDPDSGAGADASRGGNSGTAPDAGAGNAAAVTGVGGSSGTAPDAGAGAMTPTTGPSSAGSAGAGGEGSDYICECQPSDRSVCQLQELPCAADSECPTGLVCNTYTMGSCTGDDLGNVECSEETVGNCQPASWGGGGGSSVDTDDSGDGVGAGGTSSTGGATPPGSGAAAPVPGDTDPPAPDADGSTEEQPPRGHHGGHAQGIGFEPLSAGFGCSVSAPSDKGTSSAALAGLLGMALLGMRRRRR